MPTIRSFHVRPRLPQPLSRLDTLARNLWWCWNHAAVELFHRLDPDKWAEVGHNPLALLARVDQAVLETAAADDGFLSQLDGVWQTFTDYLNAQQTWFLRHGKHDAPVANATVPAEAFPGQRIAYFSAEFGISESLPIYSGGLGVLAGDHLKSASDLGLPLVGVSLLYHEAFHQYLNADGWQQEAHPTTDLSMLPARLQRDAEGKPVTITCELPGRTLHARVWRVDVGRVPLILLDSNLPENAVEDRAITDRLYGGDLDMRIRQEVLLGIGGLRALDALGLSPAVCHMNEGHSAFLALERVRQLRVKHDLTFAQAAELAAAGHCFTTHTPVPAGNDRFPPEMVNRYLQHWPDALGLSRDELMALGRENPADPAEHFCMTVLALKLATRSNGVSKLHGAVSRGMWKRVYPGATVPEVPIGSITNGIHQRSFLSNELRRLFDSYLGPKWHANPEEDQSWSRLERIPAEELWRSHERCRERLIANARTRLASQLERRGASAREVREASEVLDPKALTIGFARRFATYKRATMFMRDPVRLSRILNDPDRPVQLIFSGKAHQRDEPGKELIRKLVHLAQEPEFRHRIVFLEDYDMNVARLLVQGVDVWLNNPLRPLEASGTSGMKAAVNGGINASVLDGWWAEAYDGQVGWAIGGGEEYDDAELSERIECEALYHLLESEIVPLFYSRTKEGLPREWVERMKTSMRRLAPVFNTHRMVAEYYSEAYAPLATRLAALAASDQRGARALADYKQRVSAQWDRVGVRSVESGAGDLTVGEQLPVRAVVSLGDLTPDEVQVQAFTGPLDMRGELVGGHGVPMTAGQRNADGSWLFDTRLQPDTSGRFGYGVRVIPHHPQLVHPFGWVPVRWG